MPKKTDQKEGWKRKPKIELTEGALGTRMRKVREAAELTTVELEERIGISNVSITRIETGENNPSKQSLMLYAQEFGETFEIEWLQQYLHDWLPRMMRKWNLVHALRVQPPRGNGNPSSPPDNNDPPEQNPANRQDATPRVLPLERVRGRGHRHARKRKGE